MTLEQFSKHVMKLSDTYSVHINFTCEEGSSTWCASAQSYSVEECFIVTKSYSGIEDVLDVLEDQLKDNRG